MKTMIMRFFVALFGLTLSTCVYGYETVFYSQNYGVLTGYLCRPEGAGPFPAVIYNHGGIGKDIRGAPMEICEALAKAGFVGFAPIRRPTESLEGHVDDVKAAIDYVKTLQGVDSGRLGMIGFSRGGLLTLTAATERSDLKAVVLLAPAPGKEGLHAVLSQVERVLAPVLILVSKNDRVHVDHVAVAHRVRKALHDADRRVKLSLYPPYKHDGHHLFFELGDYWREVEDFLTRELSPLI